MTIFQGRSDKDTPGMELVINKNEPMSFIGIYDTYRNMDKGLLIGE